MVSNWRPGDSGRPSKYELSGPPKFGVALSSLVWLMHWLMQWATPKSGPKDDFHVFKSARGRTQHALTTQPVSPTAACMVSMYSRMNGAAVSP